MKQQAIFVGVVVLMVFARCGQSGAAHEDALESVTLAMPDTVDLAYRDTLFWSDRRDWLTFGALGNDSRCPTGVTCVWEGNAEVIFTLHQAGRQHAFTLNTHPTYTTDTTFSDLSVALLDVMPYPHVDSTYRAEQFVVRIFVDR